jgi:hypothetical protein
MSNVGPLNNEAVVSPTVKALLIALVATPVLYGIGAKAIEASGYAADYSDGRLLLAASFFVPFSIARFFFRSFESSRSANAPLDK